MSLAATLAAGGMRPASFLPAIKCSSCGDEIPISSMGDHTCSASAPSALSPPPQAPLPQTPASPKAANPSLSNPFTLRPINQASSKPAQPSPLQFDSDQPQPQLRPRAPTTDSPNVPLPRPPRMAPPPVNTNVANQPFLGPHPQSPLSPASSVNSGSSNGTKRPPVRNNTMPMPRLWDRPPSPELSANLDCAFPPFPPPPPTTAAKSPAPSSRSSSRSGSRRPSRIQQDLYNLEPRSPMTGENVMSNVNTLQNGPFDPSRRRPSDNDRLPVPISEKRPSVPENLPTELPPTSPKLPPPSPFVPSGKSSFFDNSKQFLERKLSLKKPPERPERPSEGLPADLLIQAPTAIQPELPSLDRSQTFPVAQDPSDVSSAPLGLYKMPSEPALRSKAILPEVSEMEAPRKLSDADDRIDSRLRDAPPVPLPVQINRPSSRHNSTSSTASSIRSLGISNASSMASPITSNASSFDTFSPLAYEAAQYGDEKGMRVPALNLKNSQKPGMRAELPKEQLSLKDFPRPPSPKEIESPLEPPPNSLFDPPPRSWPFESPMESPMDPALSHGILEGAAPEPSPANPIAPVDLVPSAPEPMRLSASVYVPNRSKSPQPDPLRLSSEVYNPNAAQPPKSEEPDLTRLSSLVYDPKAAKMLKPEPDSRPDMLRLNSYDPFRAATPQPPAPEEARVHVRARSRTTNDIDFKVDPPMAPLVQQPPKPVECPQEAEQPQLSLQPPPVPENAPSGPGLTRRATTGAKSACRGCNKRIEGKSVKAADGRLTGRWHKACFVCMTCKEPFTTADFYVINNNPYCEQHYHEKNNSVCSGCRRGIEGQYLETASNSPHGRIVKKFHRRCFTCVDCRMVLSDDYFEIAGRVYCERHALANMRGRSRKAPPGGPGMASLHGGSNLRAERRTTRLMMTRA